ncbi:MAG: tetratricopeptide repeat protein [Gammaproteobacteria bacterium]|nr:tetratricopeptide repeat protein [Gammaproteobacteria bacterium]
METEDQQLEDLKKWWKENGSSIITGVVLGLAVLFGTRSWFTWQERTAQNASVIYSVMMREAQSGDASVASENAATLIADFSGTPYASIAALLLARYRIEDNELDAAKSQLQWVLDNESSDEIRTTASVRLARVLVSLADYDGALALLDEIEADGQQGLVSEVRGDIYTLRGDNQQAVDAYSEALLLLPENSPGRNIVLLKYDNVIALQAPAGDEPQ